MRPGVIAAVVGAELLVAAGTIPFKAGGGPTLPARELVPPSGADARPGGSAVAVVSPKGVVAPVLSHEGKGWRVRTPCGAEALLLSARPLREATVVLDPGHGGEDSGAVGPNGLTEAQLNLAVAQHAEAALERAKVPTVLTRTADYNMTLDVRAQLVLALRPRAFLSVHHNSVAVVPSDRPGTEVYYQVASPESRRLAGLVHEDVVRALGSLGGPWVAANAGAKYMVGDDGDDYLGMLRRTHGVVSTLAEMAYLTHRPEAERLARPETQRLEGEALAQGVLRYLTTIDAGSGYVDANPPPTDGGGPVVCTDPDL